MPTFVTTATLADSETIDLSCSPGGVAPPAAASWVSTIENQLTTQTYDFSADEYPDITPGTPPYLLSLSCPNTFTLYPDYSDGVHEINLQFTDNVAAVYTSTSYVLVTTQVDAGVTTYGALHDPDNVEQAAVFANMEALQDDIDNAFAANDYAEANSIIEDLQELIAAQTITLNNLTAVLSDASNITLTLSGLPLGAYDNQEGTLTNTLTEDEYLFSGFPSGTSDTSETLNSETLDAGDEFADGVWQVTLEYTVNGVAIETTAYLAVTTSADCCIAKATAKRPECSALQAKLTRYYALQRGIAIAMAQEDYLTANANILKINTECAACGCGCS